MDEQIDRQNRRMLENRRKEQIPVMKMFINKYTLADITVANG